MGIWTSDVLMTDALIWIFSIIAAILAVIITYSIKAVKKHNLRKSLKAIKGLGSTDGDGN